MELYDLAKQLVSYNTVSEESETLNMADFIAEQCKLLGFKTDSFIYTLRGKQKCNLVAYRGGRESHLALSGHMDTVPFDRKQWRTDPLQLTVIGDRLYGLGIADMKLFLAIALRASELIPLHDIKKPYALYFTSDEEIGCVGAKKLVTDPYFKIAQHIVIGEPTEMCPANLHKGYMNLRIKIWAEFVEKTKKERSTHSSKEEMSNIVEVALPIALNALGQFRNRLKNLIDDRFMPSYPTMNIGGNIIMPSNAAKNTIPRSIVLLNDIRPIPGQDPDDLFNLLKRALEVAISNIKSSFPEEKFFATLEYVTLPTLPMDTSPEETIVQQSLALTPYQNPMIVPFNTEGGVFNNKGAQTVIWGPASIKDAHRANESAHICWIKEDIVNSYVSLIRYFCCEGV